MATRTAGHRWNSGIMTAHLPNRCKRSWTHSTDNRLTTRNWRLPNYASPSAISARQTWRRWQQSSPSTTNGWSSSNTPIRTASTKSNTPRCARVSRSSRTSTPCWTLSTRICDNPINTNNYVLFTSSISHYLSAAGGD